MKAQSAIFRFLDFQPAFNDLSGDANTSENKQEIDKRILAMSGSGPKRTIQAGRRRQTTPDGERKRSETPQRRREGTAGGSGGGVGGFRPSGGLSLPGGMPKSPLGMGLLILIIIVCGGIYLLFGGSLGGGDQTAEQSLPQYTEAAEVAIEPTLEIQPTNLPRPTKPAVSSTSGEKWLVLLYQDADDKILEQDIYLDLNEAERAGSDKNVQILAQIDRFEAGYAGDGDWSSTKRFEINLDDDFQRIRSVEVEDLGEVNMADGKTLVDFVTWAIDQYPADKVALILSDHGLGWPGGWSDPSSAGSNQRATPMEKALGNQMYLNELDQALASIQQQTGIDKFELIGMDACLMGHAEVFSALTPYARYAVASQETEPSLGWAYTGFLEALKENPQMSGGDLAKLIVNSYIVDDQRIVDDQARAEFARQATPFGSLFGGQVSAEELTRQLSKTITLTAIDLSAMSDFNTSLNNLAYALQGADPRGIAQARNYAQSFTNIFSHDLPSPYLDLGNFARLIGDNVRDTTVKQSVDDLLSVIDQVVIAEKSGPEKPGATGISIYFPNSQLYRSPVAGPQSYLAIAERFSRQSLWDDFLAYHYTGRPFEADDAVVAMPEPGQAIRAPAAGGIRVSELRLSENVAAPAQPVILSADIDGENIGYIKFFAGFFDQDSKSIYVADIDYLDSFETQEADGVYYPDWGEGEFTLEFEWEPIVYGIDDGNQTVQALLRPENYGANPEETMYTLDGIYTYLDGGETLRARLYFQDERLQQVFGFSGGGETGAPREIIPQPGDSFTVLETWMDLDSSGRVSQVVAQEGGTLTFGTATFRWIELDAAVGTYIVGFIIEDLDGGQYPVYQQVSVR